MEKWLRDQWHQIRGDAKWWMVTSVGGWAATIMATLITTLITWWGWVIELPGPYLVVLALIIVALCVNITNGLRQWWVFRQWEQGQRPSPPKLPQTPPTTPNPSPITTPKLTLTKEQAIALIARIKHINHIIYIKIISLPEYLPFAEELEYTLGAAGCRVIADTVHHKAIFHAQSVHKNNMIVLRYQKHLGNLKRTSAHIILAEELNTLIIPQLEITSPVTSSLIDFFPREIFVDYFQIELGGES